MKQTIKLTINTDAANGRALAQTLFLAGCALDENSYVETNGVYVTKAMMQEGWYKPKYKIVRRKRKKK